MSCCVRCGTSTDALSFCVGCGLPICDDRTPGRPCDEDTPLAEPFRLRVRTEALPFARSIGIACNGDRTIRHVEETALDQPAPTPRGVFIVFEGGEGSGKTTQATALAGRLVAAGHAVTVTREPGGTPTGQRIRDIVLHSPSGNLPARAELLLFLADRAIHVEQVIRPALERGDIVVCDRFSDSTVAYQGQGRGLAAKEVRFESRIAAGGLEPDLVFLLDIDPKIGLERAGRRGDADRIEGEVALFHDRVRLAFLDIASERTAKREAFPNLATDPRYVVLDATEPVDTLGGRIDAEVAAMLADSIRPDGHRRPTGR